jgi:hypothetical protein
MKLPLQKDRRLRPEFHGIAWKSASPFIENRQAQLIHRPRTITTHKIGSKWKSHIAIGYYCGMHCTGTDKFTFLDATADDAILCARCEENAVKAGLPAASTLVGRHVHIGGVVAIKHCCKEENE